jgi:hypothetical protein
MHCSARLAHLMGCRITYRKLLFFPVFPVPPVVNCFF